MVLSAMPGTMLDLYRRTALPRHALRDLVQAMKWDGLCRRDGEVWLPEPKRGRVPHESALPCPVGNTGPKFGVVLVAVPGWPVQDPGRFMEFARYPTSREAVAAAQRLRALYPRMKWTAARMRRQDLLPLLHAQRQGPHPARAEGPASDAPVPQWIMEL